MSQLSDSTLDSLFKSPDYAVIEEHENLKTNILRDFDQLFLMTGGLSNLFSYVGNWLDGMTGNRTLFHGLSWGLSLFPKFVFKSQNPEGHPMDNLDAETTHSSRLSITYD